MIKVAIIDDEPELRDINRMFLTENFPDLKLVGEAGSVTTGVELIQKENPDIVLLDIELEGGTGFHLLQKVDHTTFHTIFITAYSQFAIKAIKFNALDYLLKPVNEFEFNNAINTAIQKLSVENNPSAVENLLSSIEQEKLPHKIVLRTTEALYLTNLSDICYCKSDNSYTTFHLVDGKKILVSKGIKEYSELFEDQGFFRPHQSYLVNINYISKIDKSDGGFIIMKNGTEIPVSARRKQALMKRLEQL